jgi:hypothetical protein
VIKDKDTIHITDLTYEIKICLEIGLFGFLAKAPQFA